MDELLWMVRIEELMPSRCWHKIYGGLEVVLLVKKNKAPKFYYVAFLEENIS